MIALMSNQPKLFSSTITRPIPGSNHAIKLTESSHRTRHCDFTFPPCTGNNDVSTCLACTQFRHHIPGLLFMSHIVISSFHASKVVYDRVDVNRAYSNSLLILINVIMFRRPCPIVVRWAFFIRRSFENEPSPVQ